MIRKFFIIFLIITFALVSCSSYDDEPIGSSNHPPISPFGVKVNEEVLLYFPSIIETNLVKESRVVHSTKSDLNNAIIEELLKGTEHVSRLNIIPKETKLLSLEVVNKVAYVSFSKDLINQNYTEKEEAFVLYSIVNTLTEREDINKVQILVEGEIIDVLSNRYTIYYPKEYSDIIVNDTYDSPIQVVIKYFNALLNKEFDSIVNLYSSAQKDVLKVFYGSYYHELYENMFSYKLNGYKLTGYDKNMSVIVNVTIFYDKDRPKETQVQYFDLVYEKGKFKIDNINIE